MEIIVLVTTKDQDEAKKVSRALIEEKLAACVNIVPAVQSVFWWDGKIEESAESLLVIKSVKRLLPEIVKAVKAVHSYDVPEVIAVSIADGNKDYLKWINDSVQKT